MESSQISFAIKENSRYQLSHHSVKIFCTEIQKYPVRPFKLDLRERALELHLFDHGHGGFTIFLFLHHLKCTSTSVEQVIPAVLNFVVMNLI